MTAPAPRVLWPGNRLPVTVLLDDPCPARNPAWYEFPEQGQVAVVPNSFTERFADIVEQTGAAGKFSIIPCPGARGRIDQGLPDVSPEELDGFLRIVRDRISPTWDLCPEMLTHNKALDLRTMQPLPQREDAWAAHQDEVTLTPYIELGLQMLRNVDLEPNGVTSPWQFGIEVEDAYSRAISTALREVCGVRCGWYFLHVDGDSPVVEPEVKLLDAEAGTALVSLISACGLTPAGHHDVVWRTQYGEPPEIDSLLTADGKDGRLAELFANRSPMMWHTHWQSMFSNGSGVGLEAIGELFERINLWGNRIRWMPARELAAYAAARQTTQIETTEDARAVKFKTAFPVADFTVLLPCPPGATSLTRNGRPVQEVPESDVLTRGDTWCHTRDGAMVCISLEDGAHLEWSS